MKVNIKELSKRPERLVSGHRLCSGCGAPIVARMVLLGTEDPVVIANATGCLEVATTIYPYTAWNTPFIHSAFENAGSTASGVEAAYQALKRKGKINRDIKVLAIGGDGGTYDIGLQALSGALERGHDFVYLCYDNGAYMNTGIQRSGSTPRGSSTTTSPAGEEIPGKQQVPKDLTAICAAHNVPYVAQGAISNWKDLIKKSTKAFAVKGPAVLNVLSPCPPGWKHANDKAVEISDVAVNSKIWPLYEVEDGQWRITYRPRERKMRSAEDWLQMQGRFRHLKKSENKHIIEETQKWADENWKRLERMEEATKKEDDGESGS